MKIQGKPKYKIGQLVFRRTAWGDIVQQPIIGIVYLKRGKRPRYVVNTLPGGSAVVGEDEIFPTLKAVQA